MSWHNEFKEYLVEVTDTPLNSNQSAELVKTK